MPARCFPKYTLLSKTCSEFLAVLNSLKSHYNKIPPKLLDFVPRLLSRTAESLRRRIRVWRRKKGRKFHLVGKREEKTIRRLGKHRPQDGKIGRSSENSSTLLRPYISSEKNNGYFLLRLSASVEMKTPGDPEKRKRGQFWFFRDNARSVNNCCWIKLN